MSDEPKKTSKLSEKFWGAAWKVTKFTLMTAFSFAVLGALDFTLFHELAEGQYFMESIKGDATSFLRADVPILGASIADGFTAMGDFFSNSSSLTEMVSADEVSKQIEETLQAPSNQGFFKTPS